MSNHRLLIRIAEHDGIVSVVLTDEKDAHMIPLVLGGIGLQSSDVVREAVINAVESAVSALPTAVV